MSEVIFAIVIALLLGLIAYLVYEHRLERAKMLNLLLAKNNQEAVNMQLADQTKTKIEPMREEIPDLQSINEVSDESFDNFIKAGG